MSTDLSSRGKFLEGVIHRANDSYLLRGIAYCDKDETAMAIKTLPGENGAKGRTIVSGHKRAPKVDYKGNFYGGASFAFDAKESADEEGLFLKEIRDTQIDYFRIQQAFNSNCFLIVYSSHRDKYYRVPASVTLIYWDGWQINKGRRGYNRIPYGCMEEIRPGEGLVLDYLKGWYLPGGPRAKVDEKSLGSFLSRGSR